MGELTLPNPSKVRAELVIDGITYEVELTGGEATFGIEHHCAVVPSDEPWIVREPTGWATIRLTAFGQLVKSERRERPPVQPRRAPGGRLPAPAMDAACTRCQRPRSEHGGPKKLGACPDQSGITARRFSMVSEA